jgi:hypothetical protein
MEIKKVGKKYRVGRGKVLYKSKAKAERAYRAYLAKKHIPKSQWRGK